MTKPPSILTHEHFAEDVEEQVDPHGFAKGHHHGHVILSAMTLRTVLVALLLLTGLTVFCAQAETWIMAAFHITLPNWLNVAVAITIATIKSIIVCMYFMQLRYDNPLNSVIFLFCLFALALFLGFTIIDLTGRGHVDAYKGREIVAGGMGNLDRTNKETGKTESITGAIFEYPKAQLHERVSPEDFEKLAEIAHKQVHHVEIGPNPWKINAANQSRSKAGLTGALDAVAPASEGRPEGHREH